MSSNSSSKQEKQEAKFQKVLESSTPETLSKALAEAYPNASDMPQLVYPKLTQEQLDGWFDEISKKHYAKHDANNEENLEFNKFLESEDTQGLILFYKKIIDSIVAQVKSLKGEKVLTIVSNGQTEEGEYESDDSFIVEYEMSPKGYFAFGKEQPFYYHMASALDTGNGTIIVRNPQKEVFEYKENNKTYKLNKSHIFVLAISEESLTPMTAEDSKALAKILFDDGDVLLTTLQDQSFDYKDWTDIPGFSAESFNPDVEDLDLSLSEKHKDVIDNVLFEVNSVLRNKMVTIIYPNNEDEIENESYDISDKGEFIANGETFFRYYLGLALEKRGSLLLQEEVKESNLVKKGGEKIRSKLYSLGLEEGEVFPRTANETKFAYQTDSKKGNVTYGSWFSLRGTPTLSSFSSQKKTIH